MQRANKINEPEGAHVTHVGGILGENAKPSPFAVILIHRVPFACYSQ